MVAASVPARAAAPAVALRIANRLSESLPAHHALQDARGNQGRRRGDTRRSGRIFCRTDLPDRRRRGAACCSARAGRRDGARKIIDRLASIYGRGNLYLELQRHQQRDEECRNQSLLSLASALVLASDRHQRRPLCNGKGPRDSRRVHRHSPSHNARPGRPLARCEFCAASALSPRDGSRSFATFPKRLPTPAS